MSNPFPSVKYVVQTMDITWEEEMIEDPALVDAGFEETFITIFRDLRKAHIDYHKGKCPDEIVFTLQITLRAYCERFMPKKAFTQEWKG